MSCAEGRSPIPAPPRSGSRPSSSGAAGAKPAETPRSNTRGTNGRGASSEVAPCSDLRAGTWFGLQASEQINSTAGVAT